jgi:hypothetical protein
MWKVDHATKRTTARHLVGDMVAEIMDVQIDNMIRYDGPDPCGRGECRKHA